MPILIDEKFFLKVKQAPNKEEFHQSLRSLITRANMIYNSVFKSDRSEHIQSFPVCKKNYIKIQAIIKNQKFSIKLFKVYHLEAELACIQSDFNALNFNVKSEEDLNLFTKNLKIIKLNFDKFNKDLNDQNFIKQIDPETNDVYKKLLNYHKNFLNSWDDSSNRLVGDTYYIFAEYLEKTSLPKAIDYFNEAANFYKKAKLLKFEDQTRQQIKKLEITLKELLGSSNNNPAENFLNLAVALTRLPETPQIEASKRKKSTDTVSSVPAKKSKRNKQIDYKKLLAELKQVEIENYTLPDPFSANEFIRYKASLAGKYALDKIEELSFQIKNLSDTEKLYCLKEAQNGFSHSIKFYSQAELVMESKKIIEYYDTLTLVIDSLESKGLASRPSIEKPISHSNKKFRQESNNEHSHQPIRYTRTFFRELSCPENDVVEVDKPSCDKPNYSS